MGHTALRRFRGRRGFLAITASVLALTGISIGIAPRPSSQAAQGQKWLTGVHYAGVLTTNSGQCTVTVITEFLAITAKHCGTVNPVLKLNISAVSTPGNEHAVKSIVVHRDLDVEAIILRDRTGLPLAPVGGSVTQGVFYTWGYGQDRSNNLTNHLTRAEFSQPLTCADELNGPQGSLCWQTTATNSVCNGDSGGPVTQNGVIIGMMTTAIRLDDPAVKDCSTISVGQALTVQEMQPWLDQMILDADPFP